MRSANINPWKQALFFLVEGTFLLVNQELSLSLLKPCGECTA